MDNDDSRTSPDIVRLKQSPFLNIFEKEYRRGMRKVASRDFVSAMDIFGFLLLQDHLHPIHRGTIVFVLGLLPPSDDNPFKLTLCENLEPSELRKIQERALIKMDHGQYTCVSKLGQLQVEDKEDTHMLKSHTFAFELVLQAILWLVKEKYDPELELHDFGVIDGLKQKMLTVLCGNKADRESNMGRVKVRRNREKRAEYLAEEILRPENRVSQAAQEKLQMRADKEAEAEGRGREGE